VLHDTVILLRTIDICRARTCRASRAFHVHVLARLASPDSLHRVVVIRRGDGDGSIFLSSEQLRSRYIGRALLPSFSDIVQPGGSGRLVDIAAAAISTRGICAYARCASGPGRALPRRPRAQCHLRSHQVGRIGTAASAAELRRKCLRFTSEIYTNRPTSSLPRPNSQFHCRSDP